MYRYKKSGEEILAEMAENGYTSYILKKYGLMAQGTLTKIRNEGNITLDTLSKICIMLKCNISDIIYMQISDVEKSEFYGIFEDKKKI